MSIESKHAYRFGYLKSEKWQAVRLEALVHAQGCCKICGEESISNDAHHVWYPERIYDTTPKHLVILCRPCHDFVHAMLPDCKTRGEGFGRDQWLRFYIAVMAWRGVRPHQRILSAAYAAAKRTAREELDDSDIEIKDDTGLSIHIPDTIPDKKSTPYVCKLKFTLPCNLGLISEGIPVSRPDRPVMAMWGGKMMIKGLSAVAIQNDVYMARASQFSTLSFHEEGWHEDLIARSKAVSAYIAQLPSKWPCFIFTYGKYIIKPRILPLANWPGITAPTTP